MDENCLWTYARDAAALVLKSKHRAWIYSSLVCFQCSRYLFRFVVIRLLVAIPGCHTIAVCLRRKVALRAVKETKMIALVRDLGVHAKSRGPFDHVKTQLVIDILVGVLTTDPSLDQRSLHRISQTLFRNASGATPDHWVVQDLVEMARSLPPSLLADGFFGKVVRTMVGVVGFCLHHDKDCHLERAIALGFHFGVLYLYDEVQDIPHLVNETEAQWVELRILALLSMGETPPDEPPGNVSLWLHKSASHLERLCPKADYRDLYTYLQVLAKAQKLESADDGRDVVYTYTLLAMKAALTRLIPAALANWSVTTEYVRYAMTTGIANQLIDDLRDFPEDHARQTPTPYVRYAWNPTGSPHPFTVYLRAIEGSIAFLPRHRWMARVLWSIRLTHGMRVLALKTKRQQVPSPLDVLWRPYVAVTDLCRHEIVDVEAVLASRVSQVVSLATHGERSNVVSH